jgi:hypothetical protein
MKTVQDNTAVAELTSNTQCWSAADRQVSLRVPPFCEWEWRRDTTRAASPFSAGSSPCASDGASRNTASPFSPARASCVEIADWRSWPIRASLARNCTTTVTPSYPSASVSPWWILPPDCQRKTPIAPPGDLVDEVGSPTGTSGP